MRRSGIRKRKEKVDGNVGFFLYVPFYVYIFLQNVPYPSRQNSLTINKEEMIMDLTFTFVRLELFTKFLLT